MQFRAEFKSNTLGQRIFLNLCLPNMPKGIGVVFCPPFGEERNRSYRVLNNFSSFLGKKNIPSLRFDYRGSGDSDLESSQICVSSMLDDIEFAVSSLKESTKVTSVILVGLRFGATLASIVAARNSDITGLGLFNIIPRGNTYWRELVRTKQFSSISLGQQAPKSQQIEQDLQSQGSIEIEAQVLTLEFVDSLRTIDILSEINSFSKFVFLANYKSNALLENLNSKITRTFHGVKKPIASPFMEEREYWSNMSLYDQYIPTNSFVSFYNSLLAQNLVDE